MINAGIIEVVKTGEEFEGFRYTEFVGEIGVLQAKPDQPVQFGFIAFPFAAGDVNVTPVGFLYAFDHLHERGLACAVRPQQAKELPALHAQVDATHSLHRPEGFMHPPDLDHRALLVNVFRLMAHTACVDSVIKDTS
jgi:hypothetical protein